MRAAGGALLALFVAAAAQAQEAPICADRPAKANAVCTVPPGRVQLETSGADWTLTETGGGRTQLLTIGASVTKFGLTGRSDLEIGFTPYAELTITPGLPRQVSGIGDVLLRYKHRLTAPEASIQIAVLPFVKLPTAAPGLGNDRVEGGVAVPISASLAGSASITLGPELDLLADAAGGGQHAAIVNVVNLSAPLGPRLTVAAEFWSTFNFDPEGTIEQASIDGAVAYAASPRLQLDAGANVGLTRATPDFETYFGVSVRF